ncbi:MAG TPA: acyl carrier protein [Nitrospirota bacterium]
MLGTKDQIVNDLKKILVEDLFVEVPIDDIKLTDSLSTDIGLDSVAHIELFAIVQDKYGINVPTDQDSLVNYRTVQSMSDFIWNNLQSAGKKVSA